MLRILSITLLFLFFSLMPSPVFASIQVTDPALEQVCQEVSVGENSSTYYTDKEELNLQFPVPKGPSIKVGGKKIELTPSTVEEIEINNNPLPTTVAPPKCQPIPLPLGGMALNCIFEDITKKIMENISGKSDLPDQINYVDVEFNLRFKEIGKIPTTEVPPCPKTTAKVNIKVENTARQNVPLPPIPPTPQEKPFPTCSPEDFQKGICTTAEGKPCSADPEHLAFSTAIGCIRTNPQDLAMDLLKFGIGTGGGLSFLMMLFGAFQMLTSSGNPETLNAGRSRLTSAVIGLLFIIFAILFLQIIGINILNLTGFSTS